MRFGEAFLDELKARVRPSDVVGKHVKLKRQGKEFAGLSPFTNEKTPSFFVNDQKGFYHCFSSGKHGDAISFLMEIEGLSFPEAVERLAEMAGMEMPKQDPEAQRRANARAETVKVLVNWMERAQEYFAASLFGDAGAEARSYLKGRGLDGKAAKRFGLGFAPDAFEGLKNHLVQQGATEKELIDAGLLVEPEDQGRAPWDRFRDRIMFPIYDAKRRLVAFGGRAMAKDARAKYLNSPETDVFSKGRLLYNYHTARSAASDPKRESRGLIVAEGYMDVIALVRAGFEEAVAPLGTALTEDQIGLLWRAGPEATLCFDGDAAGLRAAFRSVERALPLLKPGYTLRFAMLPDGQDPDDLIQAKGREAMREVLDRSVPLVDMLWERELREARTETPEGRAGLKAELFKALNEITHEDVKVEYRKALLSRFDQQFGWKATRGKGGARSDRRVTPRHLTAAMKSGTTVSAAEEAQERRLVHGIVEFPALLEQFDEVFFALPLQSGLGRELQRSLLSYWRQNMVVDKSMIHAHIASEGLGDHLSTLAPKRRDTVAALGGKAADPDTRAKLWKALADAFTGQDVQHARRDTRSRMAETIDAGDVDALRRLQRARLLSPDEN